MNLTSRFEVIEHTADVGLRAYGRTGEELFHHMALGMFSLVADVTSVNPMASVPILVQAENQEELLVAWLRELLYAAQRDHMVFMNCKIHQWTPHALTAEAAGEAIDPSRHSMLHEIKAVTYHDLVFKCEGDLWIAQVIFDI